MKYLYLVVEADELELPIGVYDTTKDICAVLGISYWTLHRYIDTDISHNGLKYFKIEVLNV